MIDAGARTRAWGWPGGDAARRAAASGATAGPAPWLLLCCLLLVTAGCLGGEGGTEPTAALDEPPEVPEDTRARDAIDESTEPRPANGSVLPTGGPGSPEADSGGYGSPSAGDGPFEPRRLTYRGEYDGFRPETASAGAYVSDVDGDGLRDVLLTGNGTPVLFRNTGGSFEPVRRFDRPGRVATAAFFDHDEDGREDLYLVNQNENDTSAFYENVGGRFVRRDVGLERSFEGARGLAVHDHDRDGCLDVYVTRMNDWRAVRPAGYGDLSVAREDDNGAANVLFDGDCGSFAPVDAGVGGTGWSFAASFVDLTGNGWPDIHVANDFNNDVLYRNRGGRFTATVLGEATNRNGMASEIHDVDGDGRLDVFVSNIYVGDSAYSQVLARRYGNRIRGNNMLLNRGNGSFVDRAEELGVRRGGWGWAAVIADFDADGHPGLFQGVADSFAGGTESTRFWRGGPDGFVSTAPTAEPIDPTSLGIARLDVDGDGRPDLVLSNVLGDFVLLENAMDTGHWLRIDPGTFNASTAGTRVVVEAGERRMVRRVHARTDLMSQDSRVLHFGLGDATHATVTVETPGGDRYTRDVEADQRLRLGALVE